jgi:hypothetical protein
MNLIYKLQKKIIKYSNKKSKKSFKCFGDIDYQNSWSLTLGSMSIKNFFFKNSLLQLLRDYFLIFYKKNISQNYSYFFNYNFLYGGKNIENVIISFKNDNSNFDSHFSANRKKSKKSLWFLLDIREETVLKKKEESQHLLIVKKKKENMTIVKIKTIILFPLWLFKKNKNFYEHDFFYCLKQAVLKISVLKIKRVFLPYESQPYQKYLIDIFRNKFPKIKIIGYCHAGLPSLPIEFFVNKNVDNILVHSRVEKMILINFFKWKTKQIFTIKSLRHINKYNIKQNFLYLSYYFIYNKKLKNDLKLIFELFKLDKFKTAPHPHTKNLPYQKNIITYFEKLRNLQKENLKPLKKCVICIGVTGSILEALQNDLVVIHITNNPAFEIYSNFLWKNIYIKKISERIFLYKLKKNQHLLNYSNKNFFLKKYNL